MKLAVKFCFMLTIINARPEHLPLVQNIAQLTWPVAYGQIISAAQLEYMLERMYHLEALAAQLAAGQNFLLTYSGEDPIGFASYELHYHQEPITKLHKLYVLPTAQGLGAGRALLQEVARRAVAAGCPTVRLNVNRANPAIHFYQKMGWQIVATADIDIGQGFFMNDYVMEHRPTEDG